MIRPIRIGVATSVALLLVLAGCGSSGDDESADTTAEATTTTTADTFAADLNALCVTGREATDAASADFQTALSDLQTADSAGDQAAYATALDQAETAMESIIGALEDFKADVDQLDVPADADAALSDYLAAVDQQLGYAEDARDAIAADDGPAFNTATDELQANSEDMDARRAEAATQLGADDCAPDDATSSTDTTDTTAA
jgi:hypothetical protein